MVKSLISWSCFPWAKIQLRILIIQYKIAQATRQYKISNIKKLQEYLVNSNEIKLFSIYCVTEAIKKYFYISNTNLNQENICITDKDRYLLLKLLFVKHLNNRTNLYFILDKVKQYITYLCIKTEWKEKATIFNINKDNIRHQFVEYKFFESVKLTQKIHQLMNIKYIKEYIIKCLNKKSLIYYLSYYKSKIKKQNINIYNTLYPYNSVNVLSRLIYIMWTSGLNWYKFFTYYYSNIVIYSNAYSQSNLEVNHDKEYLYYYINNLIFDSMRLIIRKKNKLTHISSKIISHIKTFYVFNFINFSIYHSSYVLRYINNLIYFWVKKHNIYYSLVHINNENKQQQIILNLYFWTYERNYFSLFNV